MQQLEKRCGNAAGRVPRKNPGITIVYNQGSKIRSETKVKVGGVQPKLKSDRPRHYGHPLFVTLSDKISYVVLVLLLRASGYCSF